MDSDINASKYGCLGLLGCPASSFFWVELAGPFFFVAGKCCMVSLCHWNRCFLAACFFVGISGNDIFVAIFFFAKTMSMSCSSCRCRSGFVSQEALRCVDAFSGFHVVQLHGPRHRGGRMRPFGRKSSNDPIQKYIEFHLM